MSRSELGLSNVGGVLRYMSAKTACLRLETAYLVGIVRSRSGALALLAGCELGKVAVVVTLPIGKRSACPL